MSDVRDIFEWDVDVQAEPGTAPLPSASTSSTAVNSTETTAQQVRKKDEIIGIIGSHSSEKKQVGWSTNSTSMVGAWRLKS